MKGRRINRSSASSVPSTYTSTDSEPDATAKPIRRKRRKRKVSRDRTSLVTKSAEIEAALASADRDRLAQLPVSPLGLLTDEVDS